MSIATEISPAGLPSEGPSSNELDLSAQIAALANAMFHSAPIAPIPPPGVGPSALSVGAGGVSTGQTLPPVPGFLIAPPLAVAPAPKEGDLRNIGSLVAELAGVQPVSLVSQPGPSASDSVPYFLGLAGLPGASPSLPCAPSGLAAPSVPSVPAVAPPASSASAFGAPSALGAPSVPSAPAATSAFGAPSLPSGPAAQSPDVSLPAAGSSFEVPDTRATLAEFQPELIAFDSTEPAARRSTPGALDPHAVKRDFPILRERVRGRPLVWLDNAATTQKPRAVIERLAYYYEHENSNIHRAAHTLAARATDAYEAARDKVRRFLNAPSTENVVFVRGATEGINLVAQSWGRRHIEPGDEIVITWLEHHANIVPWQQLCAEKSAKLRVAPVDSRGQVILEEYERLLGSRTKLVAMTQVSNALGTIVPVQEMTAIAHRYGACVLIDGAQAVSHLAADVQQLDCEFYVFSGHKVFAPTGIGALYGKSAVLADMPPWQGGGNMIKDVTFERTSYQGAPNRFEAGTGNIADAVGLGAALDYVSSLGIENIARYEHELLEYATERLATVPGLTMLGTAAEKAGVLSFVLDGQRTEDVGAALDQDGIAVRSGHHCAQPILRRFGVESSVRASLAPYNTPEDIDALVAALTRLQLGRSGLPRGTRY